MSRPKNSLRAETADVLAAHGLVLTRLRGQHFLVDEGIRAKMLAAAGVQKKQRVLEIGPGIGTLTMPLLDAGARVTAVEIDPRMSAVLAERLPGMAQADLQTADALDFCRSKKLAGLGPYDVVSNLPYQITSPLLWALLAPEQTARPRRLTIMVQREVGERLMAQPPAVNLLAVLVQTFGRVERVCLVPRNAFVPPPRVDSMVVRITAGVGAEDFLPLRAHSLTLAAAGFAHPRKKCAPQVAQSCKKEKNEVESALVSLGYPPGVRAESIAVDDWLRLAALFHRPRYIPNHDQ